MITLQDQATESGISKTYLTTEPFIWGGGESMDVSLHFTATGPRKPKEMLAELAWNVSSTRGLSLNQGNAGSGETKRPGFEIFLHHILAVLPLLNVYEIHFPVCKMGTITLTF